MSESSILESYTGIRKKIIRAIGDTIAKKSGAYNILYIDTKDNLTYCKTFFDGRQPEEVKIVAVCVTPDGEFSALTETGVEVTPGEMFTDDLLDILEYTENLKKI